MDVDAPGSWFVDGTQPESTVRRLWVYDRAKQQFVCVCTMESPVEERGEEVVGRSVTCANCGLRYTELTRTMNCYCSSKCRQATPGYRQAKCGGGAGAG